jgi:hypothetical protein
MRTLIGGPVADWQQVLSAMRDNDIAGMEITGDDIRWVSQDGEEYRD